MSTAVALARLTLQGLRFVTSTIEMRSPPFWVSRHAASSLWCISEISGPAGTVGQAPTALAIWNASPGLSTSRYTAAHTLFHLWGIVMMCYLQKLLPEVHITPPRGHVRLCVHMCSALAKPPVKWSVSVTPRVWQLLQGLPAIPAAMFGKQLKHAAYDLAQQPGQGVQGLA